MSNTQCSVYYGNTINPDVICSSGNGYVGICAVSEDQLNAIGCAVIIKMTY